jgi:hypothetical protein
MATFALFVSYCAGDRSGRLKAHFAANVRPSGQRNMHSDAVAQQCAWNVLGDGFPAQCGRLLQLVIGLQSLQSRRAQKTASEAVLGHRCL